MDILNENVVYFSIYSRAWVEFIALSLDMWWKGEFDNVKFTVFPCFSGIMAHPDEEDVVPANLEDQTNVEEDPLAWVV